MISALKPEHFPWFDYTRYTFSLGLDIGGGTAMLSGHTASEYDREPRQMVVKGSLPDQARTAYSKIEAILQAGGLSLSDVTRVVEYVRTSAIDDYPQIEEVRRELLAHAAPAVNTVCVSGLLRPEALLEIEVIAKKGGVDDPLKDVIYIPSIVASGGGTAGQQLASAVDVAHRQLQKFGCAIESITKVVCYWAATVIGDGGAPVAVSSAFGAVNPAVTEIGVERLRYPGSLVQIDVMASRSKWRRSIPAPDGSTAAIQAGRVLFISGQNASRSCKEAPAEDVGTQGEAIYGALVSLLRKAGAEPARLVKTIEYVVPAALGGYREMARIRSNYLAEPWPASTGVIVPSLIHRGSLLTVDAIAIVSA